MLLTFHGTGAGEPGGDRLASALSAKFSDGSVLLLDAGEGCSRAMLRDGLDPNRITDVAISHMHADHWGGLTNLIMAWITGERQTPVSIHVPPDTAEFFERMLTISYMFRERLKFDLRFRTLMPFDLKDGWRLETFPTSHLDGVREFSAKHGVFETAFGYRLIQGSRKIVLSQDIGAEGDLAGEMNGAELLVCESAHATPSTVLSMARERGIARVIFTHVPPEHDPFPARFDGVSWSVAADGYHLEV